MIDFRRRILGGTGATGAGEAYNYRHAAGNNDRPRAGKAFMGVELTVRNRQSSVQNAFAWHHEHHAGSYAQAPRNFPTAIGRKNAIRARVADD